MDILEVACMEVAHLAEDELTRFARGELGAAEGRLLVRHLLAGCPICRATARALWVFGNDPLIPVPWLRGRRLRP